MVKRDSNGRFVKGMKPPPGVGRPKKQAVEVKKLDDTAKKLYKDNPLKALLYLMNTAETPEELFKYAKASVDYINPKLSAVKQEIKKTETFVIERANGFKLGEMKNNTDFIDVTPMSKEDQDLQKEVATKAEGILNERKTTKKSN